MLFSNSPTNLMISINNNYLDNNNADLISLLEQVHCDSDVNTTKYFGIFVDQEELNFKFHISHLNSKISSEIPKMFSPTCRLQRPSI